MLNLSDNELDRLSREAAERYEPGHDQHAWQKLEQLLDKELGTVSPLPRLPSRRFPFIYAPALLILAGFVYFITKSSANHPTSTLKNSPIVVVHSTSKALPKGTTETVSPAVPNDRAAGKPEPRQSPSIQSENKRGGSDPGQYPIALKRAERNLITVKQKNNSKTNNIAGESVASSDALMHHDLVSTDVNKPGHRNRTLPILHGGSDRYHGRKSDTDPSRTDDLLNDEDGTVANANMSSERVANSLIAGNPADATHSNSVKDLSLAGILSLQPFNFDEPQVSRTLPATLDKSLAASNIQHSPAGKPARSLSLKTNRSLQIGLLIAPDISEVRYNYNNKVGNNFGVTVGYYLSNRLSLVSGFIVSKKNYTALGYDFHLPDNCGIDQRNLSFAASSARIYEIPLNLRYNISSSRSTSFFMSGGVSSYIMKKEQFKFFFHENNNGNRGWLNADYNSHEVNWFSVMNISAGFETFITKNISIQAEPYFKVPFSGIGIGQVDLNSYGINFSVKYAPALKHSRK